MSKTITELLNRPVQSVCTVNVTFLFAHGPKRWRIEEQGQMIRARVEFEDGLHEECLTFVG